MRTVNNHGRRGKNIASDLCMEHHNRYSTQKASNRKYKLEIVTHHLYFPCRDLKNFIGDRSSNVSRKYTVYRCSRGLSSLQNIRRQFGDDGEESSGVHNRPEEVSRDIRKAVLVLKDDLFIENERSSHPLANKRALFGKMMPRDQKNFAQYIQEVTGVPVVQTLPSNDC